MRLGIRPAYRPRLLAVAAALVLLASLLRTSSATTTGWASAFADRAAGTYLWINLQAGGSYEGRFIFAADGAGLFWGQGPATILLGQDGSLTVSYSGPGWSDAAGMFDPLIWTYDVRGTPQPVALELSGSVAADGTSGAFDVTADAVAYRLVDGTAPGGGASAANDIAVLIQAEDWVQLYGRLAPFYRSSLDQTTFVDALTQATAELGEIAAVSVTGPVNAADTGFGWDVATVPVSISLSKNGRTATYQSTFELVADGGTWYLSNLGEIVPDRDPPASVAGPLNAEYTISPIGVPFSASDTGVGVDEVQLWSRFSGDEGATWTDWTLASSAASSPISFTFQSGAGEYQFYTTAIDAAGNAESPPLVADATTSFVPSAWPASVKVHDDTGAQTQQERPAVVMGADGAAYAVWDDMRNGNQTDIYFSRRDPATGLWAANVRVSDPTTRAQWQAAIAIDGADNAYAVWTDGREGNRQADDNIYFAKRSASTGVWGTNVRINDDTKGRASSQQTPRIAVNSAGQAAAVWVDRRGGRWDIYSSRLPAGSSTWSANLRVDDGSDWRRSAPDVAVGPDGTVYAVWEADPWTNDQDIYWSKLTPGSSTWSPTAKLSDDPGTAAQYSPRIAVDTAGNVLVAWIDDRAPNSEVRSRLLSAGSSTWEPSMVVSDAGTDLPSDLALGMAPTGEALAAWSDARGATWDVWGAVYNSSSQQWQAASKISDGQAANEFRPAVATRGSHSVALWFDNRESWLGDIRSSFR